MKLSICMIVKNEEKNLDRCLSSLEKLRREVESELIIIDTGSTDETVNIAQKYNAIVHHHLWNNDFSSMRNISMSYATGDWIFIIDADEELIEVDALINFVGKTYSEDIAGAAIYVQNVKDENAEGLGAKFISPRVFKNHVGFHYEGKVHNMPVINGNLQEANSLIYHYGYIRTDNDLMEKKFKRTSEMLMEQLKTNPNNIYYRYQLSTTYDMHGDVDLAIDQIRIAYGFLNKESKKNKNKYIYLYSAYAKLTAFASFQEEAISVANEGLEIESDYLDLYFFKAVAYAKLNQYKNAMDCYIEYLELLARFDQSPFKTNPAVQHYTLNSKQEALCNVSTIANELKLPEISFDYAKKVIETTDSSTGFYDIAMKMYLKYVVLPENIGEIASVYEDIIIGTNQQNYFEQQILSKCIEMTQFNDFGYVQDILKQFLAYYGLKLNLVLPNIMESTDLSEHIRKSTNRLFGDVLVIYFTYFSLFNNNILGLSQFIKSERSLFSDKYLGVMLYNALEKYTHLKLDEIYLALSNYDDLWGFIGLVKTGGKFEGIPTRSKALRLDEILVEETYSYYKLLFSLFLDLEFIKIFGENYTEAKINQVVTILVDYKDEFKTLVKAYTDLISSGKLLDKNALKIISYLLKGLLMFENEETNQAAFMMYLNLLFTKIQNKYNDTFINECLVEDLNNEEEAFGVLLLRSDFVKGNISVDDIEQASHRMPSMSRYLSKAVSSASQKYSPEIEGLCMNILEQTAVLIENNLFNDALEILKQALAIAPKHQLLLEKYNEISLRKTN